MPNHVTTILTASAEVIDALTRGYTEEEKKEMLHEHEESKARIAERGGDYTPPAPDLDTKIVDFALVIPPPANMETGGCPGGANANGVHADGTVCWYNWNSSHWGTKWNAYSVEWKDLGNGRVELRFDTAWAHPEPVIRALSRKFPTEIIEVQFADEDLGSNCGTYEIQGGNLTVATFPDYGEESLELACQIKYGIPYETYKIEQEREDAEWEFQYSVYTKLREERGIPERIGYDKPAETDEEREERAKADTAWRKQNDQLWTDVQTYIDKLEAAEIDAAIKSILSSRVPEDSEEES